MSNTKGAILLDFASRAGVHAGFFASRAFNASSKPPQDFSSVSYWNGYHKRNTSLEWFNASPASLEALVAYLTQLRASYLHALHAEESCNDRYNILHLGCGTSDLSHLLASKFPRPSTVTQSDVDPSCLESNPPFPNTLLVDVTTTPLPIRHFHCVVDKGLLGAC